MHNRNREAHICSGQLSILNEKKKRSPLQNGY